MKTCYTCRKHKKLSEFPKDKKRKDGLRSSCKLCWAAQQRKRHENTYSERYREKKRLKRERNKQIIAEAKMDGCSCCPEKEPVCLDFHHLNPDEKDQSISHMLEYSVDLLKKEIDKCILVCSNCHRKIHAGLINPAVL